MRQFGTKKRCKIVRQQRITMYSFPLHKSNTLYQTVDKSTNIVVNSFWIAHRITNFETSLLFLAGFSGTCLSHWAKPERSSIVGFGTTTKNGQISLWAMWRPKHPRH